MRCSKSIPGIRRGPDFEADAREPSHVEKAIREIKQKRPVETNDPVVMAALESISEAADSLGRKIDVQYDRENQLVVFAIYSQDGKTMIRRVPPEQAIRMAARMEDLRTQFFDGVF